MAGKAKANVTAAMALATAQAVRLLQDPQTRAELLKAGSELTSQIRTWYTDRQRDRPEGFPTFDTDDVSASVSPSPERTVRLRRPASLFAHDRLERRTVKLASTLDVLRNAVGEDSAALDGVDEAIIRIHVALRVARNLPFAKRAMAHREIGSTLGALETAVMQAAMGTAR